MLREKACWVDRSGTVLGSAATSRFEWLQEEDREGGVSGVS